MIRRDNKQKLQADWVGLSLFFDTLFEQARDRTEVEWLLKEVVAEAATMSAIQKLKTLRDTNPYDIAIV